MQRLDSDFVTQGINGGLVAGAVVAAWFFAVDIIGGDAFLTPARLASTVLGETFQGVWPRHVVIYTILHFGVFLLLGVAATGLLDLLRLPPGLSLGAVFGIAVLNAVHYTALLVTGTNLLTVIPVVHVVVANLLGGMAMMTYLHRARSSETPLGWNVLRRFPVVFDGVTTGLVGGAVVAFWFFLFDLITRSPFFTPAAIGSALLLGAAGESAVQFNVGVIVAYTFLHVAAFLFVGLVFAWLIDRVGTAPALWVRALLVLALVEGMFLGTVEIGSGWVLESVGWVEVLAGNVLAVASMGGWIWRQHPDLRERLFAHAPTG